MKVSYCCSLICFEQTSSRKSIIAVICFEQPCNLFEQPLICRRSKIDEGKNNNNTMMEREKGGRGGWGGGGGGCYGGEHCVADLDCQD